jgi:hypothetical protein
MKLREALANYTGLSQDEGQAKNLHTSPFNKVQNSQINLDGQYL